MKQENQRKATPKVPENLKLSLQKLKDAQQEASK